MDNTGSLFEVKLALSGKYKDLMDFYVQVGSIFAVILFLQDGTKQMGLEGLFISTLLGKTFYELVVKNIVTFV